MATSRPTRFAVAKAIDDGFSRIEDLDLDAFDAVAPRQVRGSGACRMVQNVGRESFLPTFYSNGSN